MERDYFRNLKANKRKIIQRYLKLYYGKVAWISDIVNNPNRDSVADALVHMDYPPDKKEKLYGLWLASAKYNPLISDPNLEISDELEIIATFYTTYYQAMAGNLSLELFKGYPPKLSATRAVRELLLRGFIHKADMKGFTKDKYSIVVHCAPLTWPHQFTYHQDGLQWLNGWGLNGHTGCPALEQQKNFLQHVR